VDLNLPACGFESTKNVQLEATTVVLPSQKPQAIYHSSLGVKHGASLVHVDLSLKN